MQVTLTVGQKRVLKSHQEADELLYSYFKEKFEEKVKFYGEERMNKSVKLLRKFSQDLTEKCHVRKADKKSLNGSVFEPYSNLVVGYEVR